MVEGRKNVRYLIDCAIVMAIGTGLRQTHQQIADQACIHPNTLRQHLPALITEGVIARRERGQYGYVYYVDTRRAEELGYQ
jgi:predicted ArsR family transcriptional regulator